MTETVAAPPTDPAPTEPIASSLDLIERFAKEGKETWDAAFCSCCSTLTDAVRALSYEQLARVVEWLDDNDCYYHPEICDLKSAALLESAARMRSLATKLFAEPVS